MVRRVLVLPDVSLGFAVPQIHLLARSLAEEFQAETLIVEPDMKGRRDLIEVDGVQIHRISTRMPPHSMMFCIEYAQAARRVYRSFAPDVLVTLNAGLLPPLLLEARRPAAVIYYMLESLDHQTVHGGRLFYDINRMAAPFIDLFLVPEKRRFLLDKARLGWPDIPVVEVLNVSPEPQPRTSVPQAGRRFLYAGTLSRESGVDFLLDDRLAGIDIDVAGPVDSDDARKFVADFVGKSGEGRKRYLGLLPHGQILEMLPAYAYRLVMWKADSVNTYYASPNKFFESIAHGVPPVCTPSPQISDIVRKYHCALLSDDWGVASFCHAMWDAVMIAGTPTYANLVANCARAREAEINWPHQFDKVRAPLAAVLAGRPESTTPARVQPDPAEDAGPARQSQTRAASSRRTRLRPEEPETRSRPAPQNAVASEPRIEARLAALESALAGPTPNATPEWLEPRWYEASVQLALGKLLRPGDLAFDVGANLGVISAMMGAAVGPYGRVVAFEASPRNIPQLQANLNNSKAFNVTVLHRAVADRSDDIVPVFYGDGSPADTIMPPEGRKPDAQVESIALDDYVERLGAAPRVVKMDIEGAELLALQGFERTLAAHSPALVVEALSNDLRIGEMLQALGYNLCIDAGTLRAHEPRAVTGSYLCNLIYLHERDDRGGLFRALRPTEIARYGAADLVQQPGELGLDLGELPRGIYVLRLDFSPEADAVKEIAEIGVGSPGRLHSLHIAALSHLALAYRAMPFEIARPQRAFASFKRIEPGLMRSVLPSIRLERAAP